MRTEILWRQLNILVVIFLFSNMVVFTQRFRSATVFLGQTCLLIVLSWYNYLAMILISATSALYLWNIPCNYCWHLWVCKNRAACSWATGLWVLFWVQWSARSSKVTQFLPQILPGGYCLLVSTLYSNLIQSNAHYYCGKWEMAVLNVWTVKFVWIPTLNKNSYSFKVDIQIESPNYVHAIISFEVQHIM